MSALLKACPTVAGIKSSRTANFDGRLVFDPKVFDLDALSQYGK